VRLGRSCGAFRLGVWCVGLGAFRSVWGVLPSHGGKRATCGAGIAVNAAPLKLIFTVA
jgi:hypothetical protein